MAHSNLEKCLHPVRRDLETYWARRTGKLRDSLRQLLELLLRAEPPAGLERLAASGEVRGLRTHLSQLTTFLLHDSLLPEALCARYREGLSETQARKLFGVSARDWRAVHQLAEEVGHELAVLTGRIDYEKLHWHDALEERLIDVEVVLDAGALEPMVVSCLEGYLSPRLRRRKGYEVYGICLGMLRDEPARRTRHGTRITRYLSVLQAQPQLSAESQYGSVEPNPTSFRAILDATRAMYPQYQAIGDYHSHPYDDLASLEARHGWDFTDADEQSNIQVVDLLAEWNQHFYVTFVVALARSTSRATQGPFRGRNNTLQLSLGGCRVILGAFRSLGSGRLSARNIRIRLAGIAR